MTKTTKTAATLNNCACGEFEIGNTIELGDGTPDFVGSSTGCSATTRRVFAPGHDASLKSLLIQAGIAGMEVKQGVLTTDAITAAKQFGFVYMVQAGIERGLAKAAAPKKERKAAAPKKSKEAAAERAAALTAKMAEVAGKVTVASTPAPVAEPIVEAAPEVTDAPASTVQIKLGRWEYAATIIDGDAHFVDAKGVARVALEGNYKKI